ncbi:MAG: MipA/OmpV family protein [Gammaproteobacteria bacterium]
MNRISCSRTRLWCVGIIMLSASLLQAENVLESVRRTDLNDYALGVGLSLGENPFAGADSSGFAYPYLTTLEHPAFTRNWFVIRDGNFGVRYVTDNEWEFGFLARVQTLGLGSTDNEEVIGLVDRGWTLETGPTIGYRRFPVHVGLSAYGGLIGRRDGYSAELQFSLPRQYEWGYVVPSVELKYLSDTYADYYFGVNDNETIPGRPTYQPGAVLNPYVALRVGYRLGEHWMLNGKLGLEFLDSAVTESPIVDKDKVLSASVGVAYNVDVFRPRRYDPARGAPRSVELRIGAFNSTVDSTVQRFSSEGRPGDKVDVESVLGVPDRDTVLQADLVMRFAFYHRLEIGYFGFDRRSRAVLEEDLTVGEEVFPAGTSVETTSDSETLQFVYGYSLMRDGQKELGLSAGVHYSRSEIVLFADETNQRVELETEVPLPTIGAFGSVGLANHWSVQAEARVFALEFDRYEGTMGYFAVRLERDFGEHFTAGVGFNFYTIRLEGLDSSLRGVYDATRRGPLAYLGMQF